MKSYILQVPVGVKVIIDEREDTNKIELFEVSDPLVSVDLEYTSEHIEEEYKPETEVDDNLYSKELL